MLTGGSSGIGLATAQLLVKGGARVLTTGHDPATPAPPGTTVDTIIPATGFQPGTALPGLDRRAGGERATRVTTGACPRPIPGSATSGWSDSAAAVAARVGDAIDAIPGALTLTTTARA